MSLFDKSLPLEDVTEPLTFGEAIAMCLREAGIADSKQARDFARLFKEVEQHNDKVRFDR